MSNFPSSLPDSTEFPTIVSGPGGTPTTSAGNAEHSTFHNNLAAEIEALAAKLGTSAASPQDTPVANAVLASDANGKSKWSTSPMVASLSADGTHVASVPALTDTLAVNGTRQANLLVNGGFEIWQRGNGAFTSTSAFTADRWQISISGGDSLSVSKDTSHQDSGSGSCAAVTYTLSAGGGTCLHQKLEDYLQLRGRTVTVSVRINESAGANTYIKIVDGVGSTYGSVSPGSGAYKTLTCTRTIDSSATQLDIQIQFQASATIYIDNAMMVLGELALDYAPLLPADEWARCERYFERQSTPGSTLYFAPGFVETTSAGGFVLTYQPKGGQPTITFNNPTHFAIGTGVSSTAVTSMSTGVAGLRSARISASVSGTPLTVGQGAALQDDGTHSDASIDLEWNP